MVVMHSFGHETLRSRRSPFANLTRRFCRAGLLFHMYQFGFLLNVKAETDRTVGYTATKFWDILRHEIASFRDNQCFSHC